MLADYPQIPLMLHIRKCIVLVLLLTGGNAISQQSHIDIYKKEIQDYPNENKAGDAYSKLAWLHIVKDVQLAKMYLDSAKFIYQGVNNIDAINHLNYKYAVLYRFQGELDKALLYIDEWLSYKGSDTSSLADGLYQKGVIYLEKSEYKNALEALYGSLNNYEILNDSSSIGFTLNSIGNLEKNIGKLDAAEKSYQRALSIHEIRKDSFDISNTISNMGILQGVRNDHIGAIALFEKALEIDVELNFDWGIAHSNLNLGNSYLELDQEARAISFLKEAKSMFQHLESGNDISSTMNTLANAYLELNLYEEAEKELLAALELDPESFQEKQRLHRTLYKLYKKTGKFEKSLFHSESFQVLQDSILRAEDLEAINQLKIQYESEKKEKELAKQELTIQNAKARNRLMLVLFIFFLLSVMLLWWSYQQKQKRLQQRVVAVEKQQEVKALESLIKGEEGERLRIAQELHDGLNGDLSVIKFKLASLHETNDHGISELMEMIDASCKQVRSISHNLVPPSLKDFSLPEALSDFCYNLNLGNKEKIEYHQVGDITNLEKGVELNVYRIGQELVQNAIKHADAKHIDVQLSVNNNILQLNVEDDGKGLPKDYQSRNGIGMKNVNTRLKYLKGDFDLVTGDKGTSITINVDLKS